MKRILNSIFANEFTEDELNETMDCVDGGTPTLRELITMWDKWIEDAEDLTNTQNNT